jgi:outer membrane lipoprotein-sorting protein
MGAHRPAKTGPTRVIEGAVLSTTPLSSRRAIGRVTIAVISGTIAAALALAAPAVAENVPLPVPAPLPKTGTVPPAAAASKPAAETPGLFPFSALFGNKSSGGGLFSSPSAPEPASSFDAKQRAILDRVSGYLSSVQTMVGKFVQVGPDGGRTEGTFYIQKPGRVRFAYNPPSPIDIIADGSSVVVRDRKLATQDLYPLSQTPLRYLLAERVDLLRDTDVVSVTSDESYLTVVIEQKQLLVGTDRLMIMFDAKDLTLKQWTVTDPQGFDTTVAVFNLDSTKKPDPNLFVINYQRDQPGVQ